jgi:hypothetical protein
LVHRLASTVVALVLVTALPLAAVRAACVCDHGHGSAAAHGAPDTPHQCTPACTAATCPMHRGEKAAAPAPAAAGHGEHAGHRDRTGPSDRDDSDGSVRCDCSGEASALIGQASVAGILPANTSLHAPLTARASLGALAEAPLRLAATPPAPPPRA